MGDGVLHIPAQKQSRDIFKTFGCVADIEFGCFGGSVIVEQILFLQHLSGIDSGLISRVDQLYALAHIVGYRVAQKRKMGAAQNQRVNALILELAEVTPDNKPCDLVVAVDNAVFHKRNKKRTSLLKHLDLRVELLQTCKRFL